MEIWTFAASLLGSVLKMVPDLYEQFKNAGYEDVAGLRKADIRLSVAFGGGEGEAIESQRELEALLPPE